MQSLSKIMGLLAVLALAAVATAHRPHDVIWVMGIAPDAPADGTIFASVRLTQRSLFARSLDGGLSWQHFGHPMVLDDITDFAFSPSFVDDGIAFASTRLGGIYRTTDGGETWTPSNPGLGNLDVRALAISPGSGDTIAAATADGLFISSNGGLNWKISSKGLTEFDLSVVTFGNTANVLFTGNQVVHRSEDGGRHWAPLAVLETLSDLEVAPVPGPVETLAATFGEAGLGVMISTDGGITFAPSNAGLSDTEVNDVAWGRAGTLYAATRSAGPFRLAAPFSTWTLSTTGLDPPTTQTDNHYRSLEVDREGTVILGTFEGLYVSTDRGMSWDQREVYGLHVIRNLALSPDFAADDTLFIGAYGAGPIKGVVRPEHIDPIDWTPLGNGIPLYSSALTLSPEFATDDTVFYGYNFVFRSMNRGATWAQLPNPLGVNTGIVRTIAVTPEYGRDHKIFMGTGLGGSFRTQNSGSHWAWLSNQGLPASIKSTWIVPSPDFGTDGTIFHASVAHGVYRSTNTGLQWQSTGLNSSEARCLAVSPDYQRDRMVLVGAPPNGILRSLDGGETWSSASRGLGPGGPVTIEAIAFSPAFSTDSTVFAATWSGAVYKSTDGGDSWVWSADGLPHQSARTLAVSPGFEQDRTLFTTNYDWVYRSTDAGASWSRMNGLLRVDDAHQSVRYEGGWAPGGGSELDFDGVYQQSHSVGDTTELRFFGDWVAWYARRGPEATGTAAIRLDGRPVTRLELWAETDIHQDEIFATPVSLGWHTLEVINAGTTGNGWTGSTLRSDGFAFSFPGELEGQP